MTADAEEEPVLPKWLLPLSPAEQILVENWRERRNPVFLMESAKEDSPAPFSEKVSDSF